MSKVLCFLCVILVCVISIFTSKIRVDAVGSLVVLVAAVLAQLSAFFRVRNLWQDAALLLGRAMLAATVFTGFFFAGLPALGLFKASPDMLFSYEMLYQKSIIAIFFGLLMDFAYTVVRRKSHAATSAAP